MKYRLLFLVFLIWNFIPVYSQKQGLARIDSLLSVLSQTEDDTNKVKLLTDISFAYAYINPDTGLIFGKQGYDLAKKLSWKKGIAKSEAVIGSNYANKSDYANALKHEYEALKIFESLNDLPNQAMLYRNIGIVHHRSKNQNKALEYYDRAMELYEKAGNKEGVASIYSNMANAYYSLREMDKVLQSNLNALQFYRELDNREGTARLLGNIANFYAEQGEYSQAMPYYFDALRKETALGNRDGITRNMGNIGQTYYDIARDTTGNIKPDSLIPMGKQANLKKALYFLEAAIKGTKEIKQTEYLLAFGEILANVYALTGKTEKALNIYKHYIAVRDSVYDVEKYNEATRREMDYEYGKRQDSISYEKRLTEVKLADEQAARSTEKKFYLYGIGLVLVFSGFMFNRWRVTRRQKRIIEKEKKRSDELLLNILPQETAEELKSTGTTLAKGFDSVTVMFTDFKNFTSLSEKLSAQELVNEINYCYSEFDRIIGKYGIEKIKTIGDSYMCAGGLPVQNKTNAEDTVRAALEIRDFMLAEKMKREAEGKSFFEIRIGLNTGPVVAGIVGIKKFAYDIWGDTVNIASRMESGGEPGKVNISGSTYQAVKDKFQCEYRGKVEARNKGMIDMYFVLDAN